MTGGTPRYRIRPVRLPEDINDCADVLRSGFWHNHWPLWTGFSERLARDSISLLTGLGNLCLVAEDTSTGRVVAQLFCCTPMNGPAYLRAAPAFSRIAFFLTAGLYLPKPRAMRHGVRAVRAYARLLGSYPPASEHHEIVLFCAHRDAQGKGAGRKLMNAVVTELAKRGVKSVTLATDSTMSWQFYERYGYRRIRDLDFGRTYEIAMNSASERGYAYELDVTAKAAELEKMRAAAPA